MVLARKETHVHAEFNSLGYKSLPFCCKAKNSMRAKTYTAFI